MDLNKAMIIGNVTRDPEIRTTPNGQNVVSLGIATNRRWTDQAGQKQEQVEFHNIVAWRKLADIIGQYVKKGSKVYIEGRMQTRSWDDQSGTKRYKTEIVADNLIMLDRAGAAGAQTPAPADTIETQEGAQPPQQAGEPEINVKDIPF